MQEFLYMDGKWMYIWGSYGITLFALVLSIVFANRRKRKLLREIEDSLEE
ncbi:MAG: heme exporter protein CcmD [Gammaproteobacteria bacterium]